MPSPQHQQASPLPSPLPSLEERVEYAIAQIDCGTREKRAAIEFLREVVHKLEGLPRVTEGQQHCKKMAQAAISDYGSYYPGMKTSDKE